MLTVLLSVLVICVHSRGGGGGGGGGGRGGGFRGGGFRSSSRGGGRGRTSYSGYKGGKKSGGTLKKAAVIGATAFVGYQVCRVSVKMNTLHTDYSQSLYLF